jgi:PBSX family phage terminase large subunit
MNTPLSDCISPNFYDLHKQIKNEEGTEYWLRGGRGSTKSSFLSIQVILNIMKDPEANVVAFRRYENEIRDSVFGQLQWAINKLNVDHLFKSYVSPFKLVYEPTGQVILFKGADNPKKLKSIKLPKGYLKIAWFEEVDQFSGIEELRNIEQSVFRGTTKKQFAFYSYNPPKSARSWANAETKIAKPGRIVHYSDYRSVPTDWLGLTFIQNAEHLKETNEDAYNHEYLGQETGTGLEVFSNVTLRPITNKEISYFDHRSQGLDFGYAADPLCFVEGHFINKKKTLYLFNEIQGVGMKNSKFATLLTEDQRTEVTMADSSEPKSIDELRDEHKVNVVPVEKAPGSVEHGIKYLQDLEEIIIDPARCPLAAKEFINYALNVDRYGETISKYPDKDNHSIDAVRYMMSQQITQAKIERRKNKFKTRRIPVLNRW